jgi:predicted ribonuclease YlaK
MANKKRDAMTFYGDTPRVIDDRPFYNLNLDEDQKKFVNAILNPDNTIIFCNARAGTGKTTLAMGTAEILVQHKEYEGIVYICSAYGEKKQGFLPGSITEKSEVYFEPAYQAMIECNMNPNVCVNSDSMVNQKYDDAYVVLLTHTFLRGTNLKKKVIILDESQNFTVGDLKKTLTRCSDDCKIIVVGHDKQCDLEDKNSSGFVKYLEHFRGHEHCEICELTINHRGWVSQFADELEE